MMDSAIEAVEHSAFDHPLSVALGDDSTFDVPKEKMTTAETHHHHKELFSDEPLFKNRDFVKSGEEEQQQQHEAPRHHHHHQNGNGLVADLFGGKRKDASSDVFGASTFEVTEAPAPKKKVEPAAATAVEPKTADQASHHQEEEHNDLVEVEVEDDDRHNNVGQPRAMMEFESFPPPLSERQAKRVASQRKTSTSATTPVRSSSSSTTGNGGRKSSTGFSFAVSSSSSSSSTSTEESTATATNDDHDQVYDISIPVTHIEEPHSPDEEPYAVYHIEFSSLSSTEPKTVVKRFSQFHNLHEALRYAFPNEEMPAFPSRLVLSSLEPKVIDERQKLLDRYLKELLVKKRLWNSFHVKLFFNLYDLTNKVAIVTGSSSGVGLHTAISLARLNAHVIFACRSRDKTEPLIAKIKEETGNDKLEFMELDLASLDSVRHFAAAFTKRALPLHYLINNAGVAGAMGQLTQDGFEIHMGVNYIGHFLLTNLLLEDLNTTATKSGEKTRIVNVASRAHMDARDVIMNDSYMFTPTTKITLYPAFAQSKLAVVAFTNELALRLQGMDVVVNAVHPGAVATETIFKQAWNPIPFTVNWLSKKFLISEEEGARCTLYAALAEETSSVRGRYFENCSERAPNPVSRNRGLMSQLWEHSEAWTGLAE